MQVPRNRYWGLHPPPVPVEDVVDNGLMAIQRAIFLRKAGVETAVDDGFLSNPPSRAELLELAIRNITRYPQISWCSIILDEVIKCFSNCIFFVLSSIHVVMACDYIMFKYHFFSFSILYRYLEVSRKKELTILVKEGVDTLLMYLYRALNRVHDMENLAPSENSCIVVGSSFLFTYLSQTSYLYPIVLRFDNLSSLGRESD